MIYLVGFTLLLFAAAIVLLFAMFGELKASVDSGAAAGGGTVQVLDVPVGHEPTFVPAAIGALATAERALMLVLSTSCNSCAQVAQYLADDPRPVTSHDLFVVISTPSQATGEAFQKRPGLTGLPSYVDEGGQWVSTEFHVRQSPSALIFRYGRLVSAVVFTEVATLKRSMATLASEVGA
jgi:hypothetical protein